MPSTTKGSDITFSGLGRYVNTTGSINIINQGQFLNGNFTGYGRITTKLYSTEGETINGLGFGVSNIYSYDFKGKVGKYFLNQEPFMKTKAMYNLT